MVGIICSPSLNPEGVGKHLFPTALGGSNLLGILCPSVGIGLTDLSKYGVVELKIRWRFCVHGSTSPEM